MQLIKKYLKEISGDKIFKDGQKIFQNDGVSFVMFKEKEKKYRTTVYPNVNIDAGFSVTIIEKDQLEVNCTCNNFKKHGRCEHAVAVMLKVCEQFVDEEQKKEEKEQGVLNMFANYYHLDEIIQSEKINLVLKIKPEDTAFNLALAVRVNNKTFAITDIRKFILDVNKMKELKFGKFIKLENYHFSHQDMRIIALLDEQINYAINLSGKLSYRVLPITENFLIDLLILNTGKIVDYDDRVLNVVQDKIDYKMDVNMADGNLVINYAKLYLRYIPIGQTNRLFIEADKLIINDEKHAFLITPFVKHNNEKLVVPKAYASTVMQQIINPLSGSESMKISKELDFKKHDADVNINVNVVNEKDVIKVYVEFKYDNYAYSYDGRALFDDQVLVNRDYEKENNVLKYLYDVEHNKKPSVGGKLGYIEYEYEYAKFELLFEIIPVIKQFANVIMSDEIKNMRMDFDDTEFSLQLEKTNRINYFDFKFDFDQLDVRELRKIIKESEKNQKFYVSRDKRFVDLSNKRLMNQLSVIEQIKTYHEKNHSLPLYKALYWHQISNQLFTRNHVDTVVSDTLERLKAPIVVDNQEKFQGDLREYQLKGVEYLKRLHQIGFSGILADEMGLGKTIQVISFIVEMNLSNVLIVVPKALILNWKREIEKFAPHLSINIINGSKDKRVGMIKDASNYDINITSYSMVRQDVEEHEQNHYQYIIIDEAQHIKNPSAQNTMSLKLLSSDHRLALSGTPIENNIMELWSIFDFLMPDYLLTKAEFTKYFDREIKLENMERLTQLKKQVDPFILKRNKKTVLKELPDKQEIPIYTELSDEQEKIYASYVAQYFEQVNNPDFTGNKLQILSMLTRLRQLAIHPKMFIKDYNGESAKMDVIRELVEELSESGQKVLIFSQFTSMLMLIRDELRKMKIKTSYLDGRTSAEERQDLIDEFNTSDQEVFLISLKAGGYGLNLTSASAVIHVDPWWNKSVERQAEDRVHRIGQKQNVSVYKIITTNTIEEKIFELQNQKDDLIDSLLDENTKNIANMNQDQLVDLFAVRKE